jgi:hypothetical protein
VAGFAGLAHLPPRETKGSSMGKSKPDDDADNQAAEAGAIEAVAANFDPVAALVRGDCRDAMLAVIRQAVDWGKFSEAKQRDVNAAVNNAAQEIVTKVVAAIASEGRDTVPAKLESLVVKDGIKLTLTAEHTHDSLVMLGDLQGRYVQLVAADAAAFDGQRAEAPVQPDQPPLIDEDNSDLADAGDEVAREIEAQRAGDAEQFDEAEVEAEPA